VVGIDLNDHTEALKALKKYRSIRRKRLKFYRRRRWSINLVSRWNYLNRVLNRN